MAKNLNTQMQLALIASMLSPELPFKNSFKKTVKKNKVKRIGVPVSGIPHKGHQPFEFTDGTIIYALNQANAQKKYDKLANARR